MVVSDEKRHSKPKGVWILLVIVLLVGFLGLSIQKKPVPLITDAQLTAMVEADKVQAVAIQGQTLLIAGKDKSRYRLALPQNQTAVDRLMHKLETRHIPINQVNNSSEKGKQLVVLTSILGPLILAGLIFLIIRNCQKIFRQ